MENLKLTFVNVGYGEAILLECPDPRFEDGLFVMVIDGGSAEESEFLDRSTGRVPMADYLASRGIGHIDLMVSTHIHEDHICGMLPAAKAVLPAVLWQTLSPDFFACMPPLDVSLAQNLSQEKFMRALNDYRELCTLMAANGKSVQALCGGDAGELCAGLTYKILTPSSERAAELETLCGELVAETDKDAFVRKLAFLDGSMNNYSLMMLLDYQGTRILLPGDTNHLGYSGIRRPDLKADLFKVGHHGQKDGASAELIAAVEPKAVVCCASSDRRYNSAHPDMLGMLKAAGADLYFSDCPQLPGLDLPPHYALTFTVGANGSLSAEYLS